LTRDRERVWVTRNSMIMVGAAHAVLTRRSHRCQLVVCWKSASHNPQH
jgi:hypothetical protein